VLTLIKGSETLHVRVKSIRDPPDVFRMNQFPPRSEMRLKFVDRISYHRSALWADERLACLEIVIPQTDFGPA
jgi:hypothetical protein